MSQPLQNILNMLQSPDQENWVVALSILETQIQTVSPVTLLACYKLGRATPEMWQKHAPTCVLDITSRIGNGPVSWERLFHSLTIHTPQDTLGFICDEYGAYLSKTYQHKFKLTIECQQ